MGKQEKKRAEQKKKTTKIPAQASPTGDVTHSDQHGNWQLYTDKQNYSQFWN